MKIIASNPLGHLNPIPKAFEELNTAPSKLSLHDDRGEVLFAMSRKEVNLLEVEHVELWLL